MILSIPGASRSAGALAGWLSPVEGRRVGAAAAAALLLTPLTLTLHRQLAFALAAALLPRMQGVQDG